MFEETKYPVISAFSGFTLITYCHDSEHNPRYIMLSIELSLEKYSKRVHIQEILNKSLGHVGKNIYASINLECLLLFYQ